MKIIKRIVKIFLFLLILLVINQLYYLAKLQFDCTDKIEAGHDLNAYETFSAIQTHTAFWLFGWVVSPEVAKLCFFKQVVHGDRFLGVSALSSSDIPDDDDYLQQQKSLAQMHPGKAYRLAWRKYTSRASLLLNGSQVRYECSQNNEKPVYVYEIPVDYKPGIIQIRGIAISETVFDYLENRGLLSVFTVSVTTPC